MAVAPNRAATASAACWRDSPVISISQPKNWSFRSIDSGHLPMGSGQPLSDGFHHIDGDSVPSLLIELGVGLERQDKVDAVIRPAWSRRHSRGVRRRMRHPSHTPEASRLWLRIPPFCLAVRQRA